MSKRNMKIEKKLQKMSKSEIFQICHKMKCPTGTKKEMIRELLLPLGMKYKMKRKNTDIYYEDDQKLIDKFGNEIMDVNKVEKLKQNYVNTQLINVKNSKPLQKEFIEYLYGDLAMNDFTKESLDELKKTLSEDNYIFMKEHEYFFYDHKDSYERMKIIGILRSIGLDFLTKLGEIQNNRKRRRT